MMFTKFLSFAPANSFICEPFWLIRGGELRALGFGRPQEVKD